MKKLPEFFAIRSWAPILLVPQQPAVSWTNGCHRRIQRIKLVYSQLSTLSDCRLLVLHKRTKMCGRNLSLSDSDRAEFLCNLLTRDFAYLSILYGSRREMPTSLIDCIVHFFIFCWELLLMKCSPSGLHSGER